MRIVITGGLGFIFSHVTEHFVAKGWNVLVIDNQTEGSHKEIVDGSFGLLAADAASPEAFEEIVRFDPEYIVHAAAITDVGYSIKSSRETVHNNVMATLNVFEAARKCPSLRKLVYVATDEVYGECQSLKNETEILFPRNPYSVSKAFGSLMRIGYDNTFPEMRGKTCEIRPCNVFGPRQSCPKIMPQIVRSLQEGHEIPLENGGEGYREYIYVKNVPPLIDFLLESGSRVYNVTCNDGYTVRQLIGEVENMTGRKVRTYDAKRPGHDMWYRMDAERLRGIGWKPIYSFHEGLREYLASEGLC